MTPSQPLEFFAVTEGDGINLWKFDQVLGTFSPSQMVAPTINEEILETVMNDNGISFVSGYSSIDHDDTSKYILKIYDMKYYLQPTKTIKLIATFKPPAIVWGCFVQNSLKVICCCDDGNLLAYDLTDLQDIKETSFNKTNQISGVDSCSITKDGQHIIVGDGQTLYILDAEGGNIQIYDYSHIGSNWTDGIVEIRPYIFITIGEGAYSLHDFTDLGNPQSFNIFPKVGGYPYLTDFHSVIALNSNPGDFALAGYRAPTIPNYDDALGVIFILHLEEDNRTVTPIKYVDDLGGNPPCIFASMKEFNYGTIMLSGICNNITIICLWNYAETSNQSPQCWNSQSSSQIEDILQIPY